METSVRHKDPAVQREFERLHNKMSVASSTAVASVPSSGGASAGAQQQTQTVLRTQENTITKVPNTTILDFYDTTSASWTISRIGTKAKIEVTVNGIMPDGTLDQTLRNTGVAPKDWVASSRLRTRPDTAVVSTGELGIVEVMSVSGDDIPALYVSGVSANNASSIASYNTDYQAIYGSTTGIVGRPVIQGDASNNVLSIGVQGNCISGKGVSGVTSGGWGCHGVATSGSGVYGTADSGYGVFGISVSGTGVYGESGSHIGVYGLADTNTAVYGLTTGGMIAINASNISGISGSTAVYGQSSGTSTYGIWGQSATNNSIGVYGVNDGGDNGIGVRGVVTGTDAFGVKGESSGADGIAGYFVATSSSLNAVVALCNMTNGQAVNGTANGINAEAGYFEANGTGGTGVVGSANGTNGIGGVFEGNLVGAQITSAFGKAVDAYGGIYVDDHYYVNGVQVVTAQQAAVADATGTLASVTAQLNDLLAKLRTHGLIDT